MTGTEDLNISSCYQCQKCSAGCPLAPWMDYKPHQVIQMINLGMAKRLLQSSTVWLCASCYTCTTRCPNDVNVAKAMDWLRQTAFRDKVMPAEKRIFAFHKTFLHAILRHGRIHELPMIARYKIATGTYFDDMKLGWSMFVKGKLRLVASKVADRKQIARIFAKENR